MILALADDLQSAVERLDVLAVRKVINSIPKGPQALDDNPTILAKTWWLKDKIKVREEMLGLLLSTGADPNRQEAGSVESVVVQGTPRVLAFLLDAGLDPERGVGTKAQPYVFMLQRAIEYNRPEMVALLLKHGASPTKACAFRGWDPKKGKNGFGVPKFPLHVAAFCGSAESVRLLLKAGAPVDQRSEAGETPLHSAVLGLSKQQYKEYWTPASGSTWSKDCARILLEKGANPMVKSKAGETPIDFAKRKGLPELVKLMSKYIR